MSQPVPLPPPVLRMDELKVVRYTLPSGQVVSKYVRKSDGSDVSLQETSTCNRSSTLRRRSR
jgi:hypothetical protein